jgi:DNA-binding XRE family transcriptional regulator
LKAAELKSIRRLRLRLTQKGFAKRLKVHRDTISDYERGKVRIPESVSISVRCFRDHQDWWPGRTPRNLLLPTSADAPLRAADASLSAVRFRDGAFARADGARAAPHVPACANRWP